MTMNFDDQQRYSTSSLASMMVRDDMAAALDMMTSCKQFTFKEMDEATHGFATHNIIGRGGDYGVVYHGILTDQTQVAVKNLLINRCSFMEFKAEVEAIWRIRHNNLVKLLGFCAEGTLRMVVYEFVDNGNLSYWLHQSTGKVSPLSWKRRMSIVEGIAKGLIYLHEDYQPAIIHKHVKSSNILLDKYWNPKISDARISSFIGPVWSYCIAPPMGMCGCTAPEYSKRDGVEFKTDVYSFGVLLMESVSGKPSLERSVTEIEEQLIDWVNYMVSVGKYNEIVDPKLPITPPLAEVKRVIGIALKCVDSNVSNRPKMLEVIHMLQSPYYYLIYNNNNNNNNKSKNIISCY